MKKLIILLYFMSFSVTAGTLTCAGTVEQIGLHATDSLMVRLSSMNAAVFVCNPNTNWVVTGTPYQTGAETCKTMMSMFMMAKATGKSVGTVWFDGDDVPQDCSSWGAWKKANVRHFLY
ncbi:MAG: hypothetical protein COB61_003310 [Thiotrichales bacterium]|nr:hypothetical protein [Thiotrichales bacterium]